MRRAAAAAPFPDPRAGSGGVFLTRQDKKSCASQVSSAHKPISGMGFCGLQFISTTSVSGNRMTDQAAGHARIDLKSSFRARVSARRGKGCRTRIWTLLSVDQMSRHQPHAQCKLRRTLKAVSASPELDRDTLSTVDSAQSNGDPESQNPPSSRNRSDFGVRSCNMSLTEDADTYCKIGLHTAALERQRDREHAAATFTRSSCDHFSSSAR